MKNDYVTKDPFRVDFNFHKGGDKDADLPLHFSIRFEEGSVFRKTSIDKSKIYRTFWRETRVQHVPGWKLERQ